ncbi:mediator complex, subunit Med11 [Triangularia verruculosa]|uniref:Mediator of RNA polymerase II transcription subunit 11 n=1 Tax=Triangularia verruculosa TaxID=2587418 RepID=A0AAN6XR67_9PEZI|nr:mediator complex, subunit Med11 [Triangularia verruculosa]
MNPPNQQPPIDIHTPFTLPEHFTHLAATERDITTLFTPLTSSLRALATPPNPSSPNKPQDRFKAAQESYFRTIDRISKHLDRQIYALEEANILSLTPSSSASASQPPQAADDSSQQQQPSSQSQPGDNKDPKKSSTGVTRLEPDGTGKYGKLDVGRLNLASSTTERDVEAETWERAKAHFADVAKATGNNGDRMQE